MLGQDGVHFFEDLDVVFVIFGGGLRQVVR